MILVTLVISQLLVNIWMCVACLACCIARMHAALTLLPLPL